MARDYDDQGKRGGRGDAPADERREKTQPPEPLRPDHRKVDSLGRKLTRGGER